MCKSAVIYTHMRIKPCLAIVLLSLLFFVFDVYAAVCSLQQAVDGGATDCTSVALTKEELKCGLGGCGSKILHEQCWTKRTQEDYLKCIGYDKFNVFGNKTEKIDFVQLPIENNKTFRLDVDYYCYKNYDTHIYNEREPFKAYTNKITEQDIANNTSGLIPSISSKCSGAPILFGYWSCHPYDNGGSYVELVPGVSLNNQSMLKSFITKHGQNFSASLECSPHNHHLRILYGCSPTDVLEHFFADYYERHIEDNPEQLNQKPLIGKACKVATNNLWHCKTYFKDNNHEFELDNNKTYADNKQFMDYLKNQVPIDRLRTSNREQVYNGVSESEIITLFCVPKPLPS